VAEISAGVPRVINLLCDRSLELAFDAQVHTIDGARVHAAARGLGIEKDAAAPVPRPTAPPAQVIAPPKVAAPQPAAEPVPAVVAPAVATPVVAAPEVFRKFEPVDEMAAELLPAEPAATPRTTKLLLLVLLAVVLGAAAVFGYLRMQSPASEAPPPAAAAPRAPAPQPAPATSAPAAQSTPQPANAGAPPVPPAGPATEGPATAERFDIIVASFRTDARATLVAEQVTALGVAVRRRESDGWQQVIAGPFGSRAAAEEAQQRIHAAGLTGTQIAPAAR